MRPITHELAYIYITDDKKIFFEKSKAKKHQRSLVAKQKNRK